MGRHAEIHSKKTGYVAELCTELVHVCAKWRGLGISDVECYHDCDYCHPRSAVLFNYK